MTGEGTFRVYCGSNDYPGMSREMTSMPRGIRFVAHSSDQQLFAKQLQGLTD